MLMLIKAERANTVYVSIPSVVCCCAVAALSGITLNKINIINMSHLGDQGNGDVLFLVSLKGIYHLFQTALCTKTRMVCPCLTGRPSIWTYARAKVHHASYDMLSSFSSTRLPFLAANRILTVGAAARARLISQFLDMEPAPVTISSSRGFETITGYFKGVHVSIVSIGMVLVSDDRCAPVL